MIHFLKSKFSLHSLVTAVKLWLAINIPLYCNIYVVHCKLIEHVSYYIADMLRTQFLLITEAKVTVTKNSTWQSTTPRMKFEIPTPNNIGDSSTTDVNVKVTVTPKPNGTLCNPKMHPQTEFGIPTLNNIEDMLRTRCEHSDTLDGQCDYYVCLPLGA